MKIEIQKPNAKVTRWPIMGKNAVLSAKTLQGLNDKIKYVQICNAINLNIHRSRSQHLQILAQKIFRSHNSRLYAQLHTIKGSGLWRLECLFCCETFWLLILTVMGVTESPHSLILQVFPHSNRLIVRVYHHFTIWVISGHGITRSAVMVFHHFINFTAKVLWGLSLTSCHKCVKKAIFGPDYFLQKSMWTNTLQGPIIFMIHCSLDISLCLGSTWCYQVESETAMYGTSGSWFALYYGLCFGAKIMR